MATLPYYEPFVSGSGDYSSFIQQPYIPAQNAAWRRGDFIQYTTTGTIVAAPGAAGSGTLANVTGPAPAAVTITQGATAGAPARTYYVVVTYAATGGESGPSQEFVVNSLAGFTPTVNVAATGAPAAATSYNVYVGLFPQTEVKQNAAIVALGTATALPYPLANNAGINRSVTNPATISGLAVNSSAAVFYNGTGGSFAINEQSLFGATTSQPPLNPAEPYLGYIIKLFPVALVEISLVNTTAWSPMLIGTQVGLTLDAATGFFVADPGASNKVATIFGSQDGDFRTLGQAGDYGKRVLINTIASAVN